MLDSDKNITMDKQSTQVTGNRKYKIFYSTFVMVLAGVVNLLPCMVLCFGFRIRHGTAIRD